jgi:hypothetical protein
MSNQSNVADFENMLSLDQPIRSAATRWERKQRQIAPVTGNSKPLTQRNTSSDNNDMNDSGVMDRFIPNRAGTIDFDHSIAEEPNNNMEDSDYNKLVHEASGVGTSQGSSSGSRILAYKNKAPAPKDDHVSSLKVLYSVQGSLTSAYDSSIPDNNV